MNADYLSQFEPENANYHRIHSPAHLTVESIQNISGHLHFLRPWFYQKEHVSFPAVLNERVIIKLKDDSNKSWYIALVRGFGVGSVILSKNIKLGAKLDIGSEIGHFDLGSTVCIATPYKIKIQNYLQTVAVGQNLEITEEVNS